MATEAKSYLLTDPLLKVKEENRLTEQAKLLFELETSGVGSHIEKANLRILDLGVGNGAYLDCFSRVFPGAIKVGVDRNDFLMQQGRDSGREIEFVKSDLLDFVMAIKQKPVNDLIVVRFVLQHLSKVYAQDLVKEIARNFSGCKLLLIDVDDKKFTDGGNQLVRNLHEALVGKQHKNGGNRYIASEFDELISNANVKSIFEKNIIYSDETIGKENFKNIFFKLLEINSSTELSREEVEGLHQCSGVSFYARLSLIQL